ncbi:hypothetical protein ACOME3_000372 [Neoechinorhynchus agilis]
MTEMKFVVMGGAGVGKSAITNRFVTGVFIERYDPTLEDTYKTTIEIGPHKKKYDIEILDTAGTEGFAAMRELYMKTGQGFVFVYSITSDMSFNELITLHDQMLQVKQTADVPVVLVGNKCDLDTTERVISRERGESMAASWGCPFLETSAKTNQNVQNVFIELVSEVERIEGGHGRNVGLTRGADQNAPRMGTAVASPGQQGVSINETKNKKKNKCADCRIL